MLDQYYDSYGYKNQESFITIAEIKDVKFGQPTRVERHLTEVESFFSESGQETGDLKQSPLLMKQQTNGESGGGGWHNPYPDAYMRTTEMKGMPSITITDIGETTICPYSRLNGLIIYGIENNYIIAAITGGESIYFEYVPPSNDTEGHYFLEGSYDLPLEIRVGKSEYKLYKWTTLVFRRG